MTVGELLNSLLGPLGLLVALIWIVFGSIREWWFTGAAYRRVEKERDEWKEIALRSINATDKAVTYLEPEVHDPQR